ncbi:DUF2845 domain-containing protein [Geobacter anodireducens]|uniref:DUF2845 domain-containing protein n=1 Tax=Geobacter anodireducens TaxID=1340425 RepID=UPI00296F8EB1|nr:DUF2845 domain-containing protein [Geobacter anodireducens]
MRFRSSGSPAPPRRSSTAATGSWRPGIRGQGGEECDEPARKEQRREARVRAVTRGRTFLTTVATEEWVYNSGPGRLLCHRKFPDDRFAEIKTGEG